MSDRFITQEQFDRGDVKIGDMLPFVGGCPRFPGDHVDLVGGHRAVIVERGGDFYYKIIMDRYTEKTILYSMRYSASEAQMKDFFSKQMAKERPSMWARFLRWWREDLRRTHHRGCGGKWEEIGQSGFMVIRIHYRCAKCQDEHYLLLEH